jgi:hypothetical protein
MSLHLPRVQAQYLSKFRGAACLSSGRIGMCPTAARLVGVVRMPGCLALEWERTVWKAEIAPGTNLARFHYHNGRNMITQIRLAGTFSLQYSVLGISRSLTGARNVMLRPDHG